MRNPTAQQRATRLRTEPTDAERRLWHYLRMRQLAGHRFRRQVPIGPYIADFACIEARLIVEVDGGQHLDQLDRDGRRQHFLAARGFRVIRFWDNAVLKETSAVVQSILRALNKTRVPQTSPPTEGTRK
jgi:adenine-specific DNA-methyltransferase